MAKRRSKRWKPLKPKQPILNKPENVKRSKKRPDGVYYDNIKVRK
jgi:hypothetical protein